MSQGLFISFEGIDGAGKSTHIQGLADLFRQQGRQVTLTREPGGTPLAETLRDMVLHQAMDPLTEALLIFAARRDHIQQVIQPALQRGDVVLCDRYTDATFAYQGGGRGFDLQVLCTLEAWVLVVHPSLPVHSVKELVALAKKRPGQLTFASSASGTQLVGELFKQATGTRIEHIPYKGAGPAVIDLLAGNVQMMYSNPTAAVPHVKTGRLRGLAVTGRKRLEALPELITGVEAGYPQLDVLGWYGIVVPTGTPQAIITKLNTDIVAALNAPDVRERMKAIGQELSPSTAEQFQEQIRNDYALWGKVVRASGAKAD